LRSLLAALGGGLAGASDTTPPAADGGADAAGRFTIGARAGDAEALSDCDATARRLRLTSMETSVEKETSSILDSYPSADATMW
jgi:hypothetical protein